MLQRMNIKDTAKDLDVARTTIQMGITVDDGFIYFNEMLYRVMRAQFGKIKFNRVMALNELVTQYRILELTMAEKELKFSNKSQKEDAFFFSLRAVPANPFLTAMFFRASFKAWRSHMHTYLRKKQWETRVEEERERHAQIGKTFTEPVYKQPSGRMEEVEIEEELFFSQTCSSEEELGPDDKSHTFTPRDKSKVSTIPQESPEMHRLKAR